MPKRYGHKKIKGGDFTSWWNNNVTNNSLISRSKNYLSGLTGSSQPAYPPAYPPTTQPAYPPTTQPAYPAPTQPAYPSQYPTSQQAYGGKRRTRSRRGGFHPNTPTNGLALHAAPVSGLATAKAHNWVGGKTKRRHHKHNKSCKNGKSCKNHKHNKSCKH
jgi:hypothetical protein